MNSKYILIFLLLMTTGFCLSGQERKLVWEENFDGNKLDEASWTLETGDGCPKLCGWGNHERQIYTTDNHELKSGFLRPSP